MSDGLGGHAVARLRAERMARVRKPFAARGSRAERCPRCRVPVAHCLCAARPTVRTRAGFCLLMHDLEPLKTSNTGWLVADVVPGTHAFLWSRTAPDPALLALLADPGWRPHLVFPADAAAGRRRSDPAEIRAAAAAAHAPRPLFVLLDATWAQARRMFRASPYLDSLPLLGLDSGRASRYRLRCSGNDADLCTADAAAGCLRLAGDPAAADSLDAWLDAFVSCTMRLRGGG